MRNGRRSVTVAGLASLVIVGIVSAYLLGRARAAGGPTMQPLIYSGVLSDTAGAPLAGPRNIQISIWDMATGGTQVCFVGPASTTLTAGAFQVVLPTQCSTAIHGSGDLWIELFVDGTSLGRTKLGAVPYSIEADHAVAADRSNGGFQVSGSLTAASAQVSGDVNVAGIVVRKIARAHGLGPIDGIDNGNITSRVLTFTKTRAETGIRVSYVDDWRVANSGTCRWEIRFNGTSCATPGPLVYDVYYGGVTAMNHHRAGSVFGTCLGLAAGTYTIQVAVGPQPAGSLQPLGDCDTGWWNQYWSIEAEEVM